MPRVSKRSPRRTESRAPIAEFSVRELAGARDAASSAFDDTTMHRMALQALSNKHKSLESEITISQLVETSFGEVLVRGRIDAVRRTRGGVCLIEIKSHSTLSEPLSLRAAIRQLQIYAELHKLVSKSKVSLALVTVDSRGKLNFSSVPLCNTDGALRSRIEFVLGARKHVLWGDLRRERVLRFCEEDRRSLREAQNEIADGIGRSQSSRLLVAYPPGSGKTRVALQAALCKAAEINVPVLWVTHSSEGRHTALEEIERMNEAGCDLHASWHTTAARLCDCSDPYTCERYAATDEQLFWTGACDESDVEHCRFCAERSRESSAHVVLADVNYILLSSSLASRACVTVIDEVHNLGRRIRDLSSLVISREELSRILRELPLGLRKQMRLLLAPEWNDDYLAFDPVPLFNALFEALRRVNPVEAARFPFRDFDSAAVTSVDGRVAWTIGTSTFEERFDEWFDRARLIIGLSGSLPSSFRAQARAIPRIESFEVLACERAVSPPVVFVPLLRLRFPISLLAAQGAADILIDIHQRHGSCCLVFSPNEALCGMLELMLHSRGRTALLSRDVIGKNLSADVLCSDFLILPLGSRFSESVNPDRDVFSCGVVLSCGYRPMEPDEREFESSREDWRNELSDAASRIVQAVGRLHRFPESMTPVYLLDRAFVEPQWRDEWPASWNIVQHPDLLSEVKPN